MASGDADLHSPFLQPLHDVQAIARRVCSRELMWSRQSADEGIMSLQAQRPDAAGITLQPLDRRSEHRLSVCVPVRVTCVSGDRASIEGTCTNVSPTGAGFDLDAVLQAGDIIEFEFRNTNDIPVTYRARVLFRNGNHYGTYFLMAY